MSKDIYVNVRRATSPAVVASNVLLQLDHLPVAELLYYDGVAPVERFVAYAPQGIYDIQQTDILTDVSPTGTVIDPKTGTNYQYRVISIPEPFPDQHMELVCDLYRGSV